MKTKLTLKEAAITLITNIADLFKVKTIITFTVMGVISYAVLKQIEVPGEYIAFGSAIITWFFNKRKEE